VDRLSAREDHCGQAVSKIGSLCTDCDLDRMIVDRLSAR